MKVLRFIKGLVASILAGSAYASTPLVVTTDIDKWWLSLIMATAGVCVVVIGKIQSEFSIERQNTLDRQKDPSIPPYIPMPMRQWVVMIASQAAICWMGAAIFYFLGRHLLWGPWLLPVGVALGAMGGAKSIEIAMNKVFPK